MNILVEAVRIFEGVATPVADQAQDGLGLYRGLDGTTAADTVTNWTAIARSLGDFLSTLHRVHPTGGPEPGPHNFFRGAPVTVYADETAAAIAALGTEIDRSAVEKVWDTAATTQWAADPQWFHGDVAADNLLTRNGQLTAVIDFGTSGIRRSRLRHRHRMD